MVGPGVAGPGRRDCGRQLKVLIEISACLLVANLNIAYFGWLPK
jgi:hypothetical protein